MLISVHVAIFSTRTEVIRGPFLSTRLGRYTDTLHFLRSNSLYKPFRRFLSPQKEPNIDDPFYMPYCGLHNPRSCKITKLSEINFDFFLFVYGANIPFTFASLGSFKEENNHVSVFHTDALQYPEVTFALRFSSYKYILSE